MVDINLNFIVKETEIYKSWLFAPSLLITGRVRIRIKASRCWSYLPQVLPSPNLCDFQECPVKGRQSLNENIRSRAGWGHWGQNCLGRGGMGDCLGPAQQPGPVGKGLQLRQGFRLAPIPVPLPGQCGGRLQCCQRVWKLEKAMLTGGW